MAHRGLATRCARRLNQKEDQEVLRTIRTVFAAAVLFTLALATPVAAQTYTVTNLGALSSQGGTTPYSINSNGWVAGQALAASGYRRAFLWEPTAPNGATGSISDLGLPNRFTYATAYSINDAGQVVGWGGGAQSAILWSQGSIVLLGSLSGGQSSTAYAINNSGEVTGGSPTASGSWHTYIWKPSSPNGSKGKMYDTGLGGTPQQWSATTYGINTYGQIANANWAFIWTPQSANGTTGTAISAPWLGYGTAINDLGQTTATAPYTYTNINGTYSNGEAAYWDPTLGLQILGFPTNTPLPSGYFWTGSADFGMNNATVLVGTASWEGYSSPGGQTVWIWSAATGMLDLNQNASIQASGWVLKQVYAINAKGQIVGTGIDPSGLASAFLLTP